MGDEEQVREVSDPDHEDEATADPGSEAAGLAADCVTEEEIDEEYLSEIPDGSGCVEVWEHLADQREGDG